MATQNSAGTRPANSTPAKKKPQGKDTRTKTKQSGASSRSAQVSSGNQTIYTLLWLMPLISIIVLIWMFVLNLGYIDSEEMFGWDNTTWFNLSVLIVIVLIIILSLSGTGSLMSTVPAPAAGGTSRSREQKGVLIEAVDTDKKPATTASTAQVKPLEVEPEKKKEAVEARDRPVKAEKSEALAEVADEKEAAEPKADEAPSNIMVYPTSVGIGLYGDTYIKIDRERILKLRTLLIEDYYLS